MGESISIVITTSGRVEEIRRLLESLCRTHHRDRIQHEIVIANNAVSDERAQEVEAVVLEFDGRGGVPCRQVREAMAGKCRAQNKTIPLTTGRIIALLDDDVEVLPEWLEAVSQFFQDHPHDIMQGAVVMRPDDAKNEDLQKMLYQYRTVDFIQYKYPAGKDLKTLVGGNIALKREVFSDVGLFDERLGPGGSGISEDVEFATRALRASKRIGWEPRAAVYNELDANRLSEEEFKRRHEAQGRSRLVYKKNSIFSIVPNLMRSLWTFGWYSMVGDVRKQYRAKGRYYHYRAMLVEKTKSARGTQR